MLYFIVLLLPVLVLSLIIRFFIVRIFLKISTERKSKSESEKVSVITESNFIDRITVPSNPTHPFLDELNNIDFQYLLFFLFRNPITPDDVRDRLSNHYKFEIECGKAYFAFLPTSDLPAAIRRKCTEKFLNYFESGVLL